MNLACGLQLPLVNIIFLSEVSLRYSLLLQVMPQRSLGRATGLCCKPRLVTLSRCILQSGCAGADEWQQVAETG